MIAKQYPAVYGRGSLWVGAWWLEADAVRQVRAGEDADATYPYRQKYPTWTVKGGKATKAGGPPQISVRQLDGHNRGTGSVGGYATASTDNGTVEHWWPTVIAFRTPGCWQITETVNNDHLIYIVSL